MIRLEGRVAIVTGAAGGIGSAIAARLAKAGASVAAADVATIAPPASGFALPLDLADDDGIAIAVRTVLDRLGRIDILVNCACLYADPGLAATREDWRRLLDVNLIGAAILTGKVAEAMTAPGGVIVNIGSVGGKFGAAGRALYPASKAALHQFTRNAAATLAPRGIRVLTVSPAWTWTPALEGLAGTIDHADAVGARIHPLGRVGRGADVADVVLFACSDLARFMTGVDIPVDGGFSMLGPDGGRSPRAWFEENAP
ncbi:MAG TPA: SDR family oxidoreductase [Sphingomonas sp.]